MLDCSGNRSSSEFTILTVGSSGVEFLHKKEKVKERNEDNELFLVSL